MVRKGNKTREERGFREGKEQQKSFSSLLFLRNKIRRVCAVVFCC